MNIIGVIPARLASSRLPNKPLANILGMPMIGHVYLRSRMCRMLTDVYVATCDQEIFDYIESIGGKVIMTANTHERASDRTAEAVLKIEELTSRRVDIVVMIQGDEPMTTPEMIEKAIEPLTLEKDVSITNLMADIDSIEDFEDPNEVKVVVDLNNYALYFSREPIPSRKKGITSVPMLKQVCIIPFKRDFLIKYNEMKQTPLEIIESVDMNRIIESGFKVKMVKIKNKTYSVDTETDRQAVELAMKDDEFLIYYLTGEKN